MNASSLVIYFIIFTAAASVGFILGAFWVDSEFEKDSEYLAAEVESLTNENKILHQDLEAAMTSLNQSIEYGNKIFDALQRSVDAYEEMKKFKSQKYKSISPEIQNKIRDAWRQASE